MQKSFDRILIPVDLSVNTRVAVEKGLELASPGSIIHLLHVQPYVFSAFSAGVGASWLRADTFPDTNAAHQYLQQWKEKIENSSAKVEVCTWVVIGGSIQKAIEKRAQKLNVDLIVIGKQSYHSWFPFMSTVVPSKLGKKTGIAVLTVKPGSIDNKVRTLVVPLSGGSITHKREIISLICSKFRLKVHLITFENGANGTSDFDSSGMLQMYQWLKSSTHCQVEHAILKHYNKAKAIVAYARQTNADMLLVHPETETRIGWLNKHISDILPPASKLQILAVQ